MATRTGLRFPWDAPRRIQYITQALMKTSFLRRLFESNAPESRAVRVSGDEHGIDPGRVSKGALQVVSVLREGGYQAYVVGGGVRDLMLGLRPKDFDIATDARPEQVHNLFPRSRIIGRRFRLVHVRVGRDLIEVATFRGTRSAGISIHASGRVLRDNAYGTIESDALRRDFTANALFYDPGKQEVLDFTGGIEDIHARTLHMIGSAPARYREDPVRMLRAVRFSAKLDFSIDEEASRPLPKLAHILQTVSPARLFDETVKLLHCGAAHEAFLLLREHGLLSQIFPQTEEALARDRPEDLPFLRAALDNTDARLRRNLPVSPSFACAVLQWPYVRQLLDEVPPGDLTPHEAMQGAAGKALQMLQRSLAIPGHHARRMQAVWMLQPRLERGLGRRATGVVHRPEFRAAYDFLELRVPQEGHLAEAHREWTRYQKEHPPPEHHGRRRSDEDDRGDPPRGRRRRGRRGGRRHRRGED